MHALSRYWFLTLVWASLSAVLPAQRLPDFDFHRLKGNWIKKSASGFEIEHWEENKEGFTGYGAKIQNADTLITETLRIFKLNDTWQYEAKVKNQNQGEPVLFTLTQSGGNHFTFENPKHDFPQKIRYTFRKAGLRVALYGPSPKGRAITYYIDFNRVP